MGAITIHQRAHVLVDESRVLAMRKPCERRFEARERRLDFTMLTCQARHDLPSMILFFPRQRAGQYGREQFLLLLGMMRADNIPEKRERLRGDASRLRRRFGQRRQSVEDLQVIQDTDVALGELVQRCICRCGIRR